MDFFNLLIYLPIVFLIIFVFFFVFLNMYLDFKKYITPKNAIVQDTVELQERKSGIEGFISETIKTFDTNEFKQIILPNLDDYDLEIAIPVDQTLSPTVQGNWGFNVNEYRSGFSTGVYRDGYTADGAVFKGISNKLYKYMLDQGPYVLRYENRINKNKKYDVRVFLNNKEIIYAKDEGISSGRIKFIGTNDSKLNKETDSTAEGRRKVDYIKFIPKSNKKINI